MQALAISADDRPEPVRRLPVPGCWGYTDRVGVAPGGRIGLHVSAPATHDVEFVKLGRKAVIDPARSLDADREDVAVMATAGCSASPCTIDPGSYVYVHGEPLPAGPVTLGLWVRPWKLPVVDVVQVGWQGLITDIDYPDAARFGLIVDHLGRLCVYAGDGGAFRHEWLHASPPVLAGETGRWAHVAVSIGADGVRIFHNGRMAAEMAVPVPVAAVTEQAQLRIGAFAEGGAAGDFLEADIAAPFVGQFVLDEAAAGRLFADRGHTPVASLGLGALAACWPLDEEKGADVRDVSGHERHGHIVNHGTWMVGGPAFDPANRVAETYDPAKDPDRGNGLRLCSDDLMDPRWPVSAHFDVPHDAPSGVYAARVRLAGQAAKDALVVPFVVTRRKPRHEGVVAVLAATNTWHAYGRRPTKELAVSGLTSSCYSTHSNGRPFFHIGLRMPIPMAQPYAFESSRSQRTQSTHLVRNERFLEAWLDREGYAFEMVTDLDLHEAPELLDGFAALAIVGHSEYWSDRARQGVIDYLKRGGKVLSLSGDTMTVRVTFDDDVSVMECRKLVDNEDARWLSPTMWGECWHSEDGAPGGSFRRSGKPPYDVLGMSFKGMIDDGAANAFAPYTVVAPDHFLLNTPHKAAAEDGRIGLHSLNGSGGASGYEFDANLDRTGLGPAPLPGVTTLASAFGQRNIEWLGEPDHGADLIYWERPDGGVVVNFGSIASAGALPVDPAFANIVHNTLAFFGVLRTGEKSA